MLNLHIHKRIDGIRHLPILNYYFGEIQLGVQRAGDEALKLLGKQYFVLTKNPEEADYFLIPHNYFEIRNHTAYVGEFVDLSIKHNKKILVFTNTDSDFEIRVPNSIVFRTSQYRYKKKKNEIIFPAIADDFLIGQVTPKEKSVVPVVGFCGWAEFENNTRRIKEYIKLFILVVKRYLLGQKHALLHKRGILFRKQAISFLRRSIDIETNFIIRDSYSGNEKTRKLSVEKSRAEYIDNILSSDFSLAIKGDGNFSIRLYEILSLGRVPLFIDTDCVLPLEDLVDYSSFMLRVSAEHIKDLGKITRDFYNKLSSQEFKEMQTKAREAFDNYLRADKYADYIFLDPDLRLLKQYE